MQIRYHLPQTWLPTPLPLTLHTVLFLNQPSSAKKCQGKRRNSSTECEQFVQADACAVRYVNSILWGLTELLIYRVYACMWPVILLLMANPLRQLKVKRTQRAAKNCLVPPKKSHNWEPVTEYIHQKENGWEIEDTKSSDPILTFLPGVLRYQGLLVSVPSWRLVYSTQKYRMYSGELANKIGK